MSEFEEGRVFSEVSEWYQGLKVVVLSLNVTHSVPSVSPTLFLDPSFPRVHTPTTHRTVEVRVRENTQGLRVMETDPTVVVPGTDPRPVDTPVPTWNPRGVNIILLLTLW